MDNINSTKTPKWSLYKIESFINNKKKSKSAKNIFNIPGPGFYPMKTFIGEGPKYSFNKDNNNHSDPEEAFYPKKKGISKVLQHIIKIFIIVQVDLYFLYLN